MVLWIYYITKTLFPSSKNKQLMKNKTIKQINPIIPKVKKNYIYKVDIVDVTGSVNPLGALE